MLWRANRNAAALADYGGRMEIGGSDAHAMPSVGCAYTVVPGARSKEEFFQGLRRGRARVRGEFGGFWKLTRDVLAIAGSMALENPWTLAALPLAVAVPLVTLGNYLMETVFARWWMARYRRVRALRGPSAAADPLWEAAA
jgi:hypothetical protein